MTRFEWCVARVVDIEGGLSNDPADPGGLTKFGISQRAYPLLDIANLTREEAINIYRIDYWERSGAARMPQPLDFYLFDCAVNQGVGKAPRLLQQAIGVDIDGFIGPETMGAIDRLGAAEAGAKFMARRALHYMSLGTFPTFGRGWLKRLFLVAGDHST